MLEICKPHRQIIIQTKSCTQKTEATKSPTTSAQKGIIQDKQIIKPEKCPDDMFVSPLVTTVRKDKSVKIAFGSIKLNESIQKKNKNRMQSLKNLVNAVALKLSRQKEYPGTFWFSKDDLNYAYSQLPLEVWIAKHCNFSILGGRATGTYRFLNGF